MAQRSAVGFVERISGDVYVMGADGQVRSVQVGSPLYDGDRIAGESGSSELVAKFGALSETTTYEGIFRIVLDPSVYGEGDPSESITEGELLAKWDRYQENTAAGTEAETSSSLGTVEIGQHNALLEKAGPQSRLSEYDATAQHGGQAVEFGSSDVSVNSRPVVADVTASVFEEAGETLSVQAVYSGLLEAEDLNSGDTHTFAVTTPVTYSLSGESGAVVTNLSVVLDPQTGAYTVEGDFDNLAEGEVATVTFGYSATDSSNTSNATSEEGTVTLLVTGTNDAPVAVAHADFGALENGAAVTGRVTATDVDSDDDAASLSYALVGEAPSGLTFNPDGSYSFDPTDAAYRSLAYEESAVVSFSWKATDSHGAETSVDTVAITVTGTNEQPVVSDVDANWSAVGASIAGLDTLTRADATITPFGEAGTRYYAQTFVATEAELMQVEFAMNILSGTNNFRVLVTEVTASGSDLQPGSVLFESGDLVSNAVNQAFSVDVDLTSPLTVGRTYAIVFDSQILAGDGIVGRSNIVASRFDADPQGMFFFYNPAVSRSVAFSGNWTEWNNGMDAALKLTYGSGALIVLEDDGIATVFTGQLAVTEDLDPSDTHTFALVADSAAVVTGTDAAVTDLSVAVAADGSYSVNGNFDALAAGETATVTFRYTATDDSGAANATSDAKTVTLTVTGADDVPVAVLKNVVSATGQIVYVNGADVAIPASGTAGTVYSTISVADSHEIADLNVRIDLTHTFDWDLVITLIAPDGTEVELTSRNGGSANNYANTLFDDEAATSIVNGSAPFTGIFRPEGDLSAVEGMEMQGTWTLRIDDMAYGDVGVLDSWALEFTYPTAYEQVLQVSDVDYGSIDLVALLDSIDGGADNSIEGVELTGHTEVNLSVADVIALTDGDHSLVISSSDDASDTVHLEGQIAAAADQSAAPAGYTLYTDTANTVTITIEDTITVI